MPLAVSCFRPAAAMREVLDFVRRCLSGKTQKTKRGKKLRLSSVSMDDSRSFLHFRRQRKCNTFGRAGNGKPRGSNGNRLFPWHTILLARSSVLYLLRPWVPEGVPLAGCGITYGTAGSGRDRPVHRQRPAAVRKRAGRNLRAMPARRFCSGGAAGGIQNPPSPPQRANTFFKILPFGVKPISTFLKSR